MYKSFSILIFALLFLGKSYAQNCTINAGVNTTFCPGQNMKLYGNVAGLFNTNSITWSQISGPSVTISNPNSLTTDCGIAISGSTYIFKISALCQDGNIVSNTVTYSVLNNTPTPPPTSAGSTVNAGCLQWGQSINLNATPAPTGFIGTWSIVGNGVGSFNNLNSPTATFTPEIPTNNSCPNLTNSYTLKWTLKSTNPPPNLCPSAITYSSEEVIINLSMYGLVNASVITPSCSSTSNNVELSGTCPGNGTANWSLISGPAGFTFTTINAQFVTLTAPPNGIYKLKYTVSGSCVNGIKEITFTVDVGANNYVSIPNANAGLINTGFCNGIPASIQLSANNPSVGEIGTWVQISGGNSVNFSNINDPNAIISGLTNINSPYTFKWEFTNANGCKKSSLLTITNIETGNNSAIEYTTPCATVILSNSQPPIDGGNYCSTFSKFISFNTFISTAIPIPDNNANGWYFKGFNLYSKPINAPNTIGFSTGQTFFNTDGTVSPFNSSAKDCTGPGFGFLYAPNGGFFGIKQALAYPYVPGVYMGSWVLKNNLCQTEITIPFKLTYTGNTTQSNAGTDQNLACSVSQTNLSGNDPLVTNPFYGKGIWEQISGPNASIINDKYNRNTLISGLISGTYSFVWRIQSGDLCTSNQDTVLIRVSSSLPLAVFAGNNQTVCFNTQASLTASLASGGSLQNMLLSTGSTGLWSQVSGPSSGIITNPSNISTNVNSLLPNSVYVFKYTVSNLCGTTSSEITITTSSLQGPSLANAGDNICLNSGTTNTILSATIPFSGTGIWSQISGPITATLSTPNNSSTNVLNLNADGIYGFVYTISTSGCATTKDTVYISNTFTATNANAGPDQNICANIGINSFSLNAVASVNGFWSQIAGPAGATIINPNNSNTNVTINSNGSYIFRWTISGGGICADKIDDVIINFFTKPSLAVVNTPNSSICSNNNGQIILNASPITNGIGFWSIINNGPGIISNTNNASTNVIVNTGITTIRWTVSSVFSGCPSTYSDVIIKYNPVADAKQDQNLCRATSTILLSSTPGAAIGNWSVISQPTGSAAVNFLNQGNDSTHSAFPLSSGVYKFRWTIIDNICGNSFDDVLITIDDLNNPNAGPDRCETNGTNTITLQGNAVPIGATALWSKIIGPAGTLTSPSLASTNFITTTAVTGTLIFQYQFTKGACVLNDYLQIRKISNVLVGPNIYQCNNGTFTLDGSIPAPGEIGTWTKLNLTDLGTINNANAYNTIFTGLNVGDSINLIWTITTSEGCTKSDTVALINKNNISATTNNPLAIYCDNLLGLNLVGNTTSNSSGSWALISSPPLSPTIFWTNQNTAIANVNNLTIGEYLFRYTLNNSPCGISTADVLVKSICSAILPVTIESFNATPKNNNSVILDWEVAVQINIQSYTLEHSIDGINFIPFKSILANNFSIFHYTTIHQNPVEGNNYYRIKIIENNGSSFYSEIRNIKILNKQKDILVYPLPSNNVLNIESPQSLVGKVATIKLFSIDGKLLIKKTTLSLNKIEIVDIKNLKPGVYILNLVCGDTLFTKKIEVL